MVFFLEHFALVVEFAALADAHQHLGPAFLEVHFQRHQRQPLLEGLAGEFLDLAAVHQQLARAAWDRG